MRFNAAVLFFVPVLVFESEAEAILANRVGVLFLSTLVAMRLTTDQAVRSGSYVPSRRFLDAWQPLYAIPSFSTNATRGVHRRIGARHGDECAGHHP